MKKKVIVILIIIAVIVIALGVGGYLYLKSSGGLNFAGIGKLNGMGASPDMNAIGDAANANAFENVKLNPFENNPQ